MKRRSLLLGAGATLSVGFSKVAALRSPGRLAVKLWLTEEAASYPASRERALDYLRRSLEAAGATLEQSVGATPVRFEGDDRRVERVAWPRAVAEGALGVTSIDPVDDVNLLLTDGDVRGSTAGYAVPRVAAVPGARHLAAMPPADATPDVVEYTVPAAVTQLLLHEVGHALGLGHEHGSVTVDGGAVTATPMVGGYAWASESIREEQLADDRRACSGRIPDVADQERFLSLRFSSCAADVIRNASGGRTAPLFGGGEAD